MPFFVRTFTFTERGDRLLEAGYTGVTGDEDGTPPTMDSRRRVTVVAHR